MLRRVLLGVIAGAAGNLTLEIVTYGDMLLRGRSASGVPAKMAGILADDFGIEALSSAATSNQADNAAAPPAPCSGMHWGSGSAAPTVSYAPASGGCRRRSLVSRLAWWR